MTKHDLIAKRIWNDIQQMMVLNKKDDKPWNYRLKGLGQRLVGRTSHDKQHEIDQLEYRIRKLERGEKNE